LPLQEFLKELFDYENFQMAIDTLAPLKTGEKDQEVLRKLWTAFLINYNAFKNGQMLMKDEFKYKFLSSPGPSQYRAFLYFFNFFKNEERIVKEPKFWDHLYMYDWLFMDEDAEPAMLQFVKNLASPAYDAKNKKIILAFGSFWKQHLPTREKIILLLNELDTQGADVRIYAQVKEDEPYIEKLKPSIRKKSRLGLEKRIAIHFILTGDCIFLEFPHTETTEFRLNWFIDLNSVEYKWWKTKRGQLRYFESLIK
jgi:hypothetical protein